ncbi:MAG: tetratricopeptide repeat protein [Ignavibacteriae bacterium]|nr:tetratricopeptide repeat protein [Ignavibacteriota bacterium]
MIYMLQFGLASVFIVAGDYLEKLKYYNYIFKANSRAPQVYKEIGVVLEIQNRNNDAIQYYCKAAQLGDFDALKKAGDLSIKNGKCKRQSILL